MSSAAFKLNTSPMVVNSARGSREAQSARRQPLQDADEQSNANRSNNVNTDMQDEHSHDGQKTHASSSRRTERHNLNGDLGKDEENENLFGDGELNNTK